MRQTITTGVNKPEAQVDKHIFWPACIIVTAVIIVMIVFESQTLAAIKVAFEFVTNQLGFAYIWAGAFFFGAVLWLSLGRYSQVRLGGPDARPEFSRLSWVTMFFCSGIGTSLIFWSSIEWTYYFTAPPFGLEPKSDRAADYAAMYGMFHWGPLAWAFYCLTAFPIGYAFYNRKQKQLRLSIACAGLIGEKHANGHIGKVIDVLMVFGLVGGVGTALASGTPMLAEAISRLLGIEHTFNVDIVVVLIWSVIFVTSVVLGLKRGIQRLSQFNLYALSVLCVIIFIGGPTFFMLNSFTNSMGLMITEFAHMAFYTDPVANSMFPQWWTIFYWAWWVAMGPYMGIFIARISRGRTFRDMGLTVLGAGSAGCILFFILFGSTSMHAELSGTFPVLETMANESPSAAILGTLEQLPLYSVILVLFIVVGFVYSGTTVDSSAYVLASVTSRNLGEGVEPHVANRFFWAVALGAAGLVLMNAGGLEPLKTASLVVGVPLLVVMCLSFFSLLRWLRADFPERQRSSADVGTAEATASATPSTNESITGVQGYV
ncbi:BCCT family transporter [Marinobacter sp. X15-166B]|uniref:BCCT family transporter n=1 Tax=Marinobacter sp. X15-166B TaxID=1897620 RepID=UPI00085C0F85|nr:BCCT family transporter [Marinobacter sp. X15-166B]OEY65313.1 L-carnitine:gamma-butyrobetaine antiporter [Marinobacter sp. X15-166B]